MLEKTLRSYHTRAIETVQVIEELIKLAGEIKKAEQRGENLGLTDDEVAFYDALETNDSAVKILGDKVLCEIARVQRILKKNGYPPDKQEKATETVLEQAETLCGEWVA